MVLVALVVLMAPPGQGLGAWAPLTSHIGLSHSFVRQVVQPGDTVVDATAGNGHDALVLAQLALPHPHGRVVCVDIAPDALSATHTRLLESPLRLEEPAPFVPPSHAGEAARLCMVDGEGVVELHCRNHNDLVACGLAPGSCAAVVFNLGYHPNGDKARTTNSDDTLRSLRQARELTRPGGLVSVCCYRGHAGGQEETRAVVAELAGWEQREWRVCKHEPLNWPIAPVLLTAHKFTMPRTKLPRSEVPRLPPEGP